MTSDDYGRRMGMALKAIRQMFADTSKLLQDCDGSIGKGKPLATKGNNATRDISYSLGKPWLAKIAFRCYAADQVGDPGLVEVVSAVFFAEQHELEEPLLLVGRLHYQLGDNSLADVCDGFHLSSSFFQLGDRALNAVLENRQIVTRDASIDWCKVIGVPLYSIASMADVEALMERIRQAQ